MIIEGKYTRAVVHTDNVEDAAIKQIQEIVDSPAFDGQTVHYMPDVHAGNGCTVGFTATLGDYVNPSHIGGDIGCMVSHMVMSGPLPAEKYAEFEHKVRNAVPSDMNETNDIDERDFFKYLTSRFNGLRQKWPERLTALPVQVTEQWVSEQLKRLNMNEPVFYKQLGTFGTGNHFIEYGCAENVSFIEKAWWNSKQKPVPPGVWTDAEFVGPDPEAYRMTRSYMAGITIHCGSRNFGQKVCRYWEAVASRGIDKDTLKALKKQFKEDWKRTHWKNKTGYDEALEAFLSDAGGKRIEGYLSGEDMNGYLCDVCLAQLYAEYNHIIIHRRIKDILQKYGLRAPEKIYCPHNYIDMRNHIIHKGSISALDTEKLVIPFNMRDGIAICVGKSNEEWNYSGPHGAGRLMSRAQARKNVSLDDYKETMKNVYSTSVCRETVDESPQAYKPTGEICELIKDTVEILYLLPSKINIKAKE